MNWRDVYSPADLGYEEDEDAPDGHCHGPQYPGAKGCGRFVVKGEYVCPKCKAESDAWYADEIAHEAQLQREMDAYNEREIVYTDPALPFEFEDEDLPY